MITVNTPTHICRLGWPHEFPPETLNQKSERVAAAEFLQQMRANEWFLSGLQEMLRRDHRRSLPRVSDNRLVKLAAARVSSGEWRLMLEVIPPTPCSFIDAVEEPIIREATPVARQSAPQKEVETPTFLDD